MDRREFLRASGACTVLSVIPHAFAQTAADYKALVCVFLYGGNDGNNTIIPRDAAGYAQYSAVRTTASGLQIALASLAPIQPASAGTPFGFHPSCTELASLFNQRKLAVMCNVGTLVQPTSKSQYVAGLVPSSLFSHSDQQAQWQSSVSTGLSATGWGGRIADKMAAQNAATGFDCGEPFCRNQIVSRASTPTEKNSLCQFWNDSNQNCAVPMYARVETVASPCRSASTLCLSAPPAA